MNRKARIGAARVSRVPWTICRGETKVSYTETIYSPATRAENSLLTYECGLYTRSATRGLYCDIAT